MEWRRLEQQLVDILKSQGYELDEPSNTGDKILLLPDMPHDIDLNITELAKELADRGIR